VPHWVSCTISGLGWKCAGIIDAILGVKSLGRQFRVSWAVLSKESGARLGVELFGVGNVVLDKGRVEGGQESCTAMVAGDLSTPGLGIAARVGNSL